MTVEGSPDSLTVRIEEALLARHPVTLPPERARNYAEIAASVVADELLKLRTAIDLHHEDFCAIDEHVERLREIVRPC